MNIWNAITIGFKEIWAHKFRSALTMLGIILGVSSLVASSALVKGMENGMKQALVEIGGLEKIRVERQEIPPHQRHLEDQAVGATLHDVYALERSAPLIKLVTPSMYMSSGSRWGGEGTRVSRGTRVPRERGIDVIGTWPNAVEMNNHIIEYGRNLNEIDNENAWNVCVIGTKVRDELFGSPLEIGREINPVGDYININNQPFRIVGMFKHYESDQERKMRELEAKQPRQEVTGIERRRGWGSSRGMPGPSGFVYARKNSVIYIPLNTMWIKFRSGGSGGFSGTGGFGAGSGSSTNTSPDFRLSQLEIKVADIELLEPALQQAKNVLMHTHRGIEDFAFQTQENWSEGITLAIRNARISGGFVAAISLIVGGIGIMNIMLASITERVREIGIRKAIGATHLNVFVQILVESIVIAVLGGIAGLLTSYGIVNLLSLLSPTENTPVITVNAMAMAFIFSVCIGMLAGLFPAMKAAKLDPIQALRYE